MKKKSDRSKVSDADTKKGDYTSLFRKSFPAVREKRLWVKAVHSTHPGGGDFVLVQIKKRKGNAGSLQKGGKKKQRGRRRRHAERRGHYHSQHVGKILFLAERMTHPYLTRREGERGWERTIAGVPGGRRGRYFGPEKR